MNNPKRLSYIKFPIISQFISLENKLWLNNVIYSESNSIYWFKAKSFKYFVNITFDFKDHSYFFEIFRKEGFQKQYIIHIKKSDKIKYKSELIKILTTIMIGIWFKEYDQYNEEFEIEQKDIFLSLIWN